MTEAEIRWMLHFLTRTVPRGDEELQAVEHLIQRLSDSLRPTSTTAVTQRR